MADSKTFAASKGRSAFTLIELLIVVAVISILMSLLLPALNSTRDSAKRIFCANGEKQLGLAFAMYAGESNDWLPNSTSAETTQLGSWCYMLAPYANVEWPASSYWPKGGAPVFYCPAALLFCDASGNAYNNKLYNLSYGYNKYLYDSTILHCSKMSTTLDPSKTLLVSDLQFYISGNASYPPNSNMSSYVSARCGNGNSVNDWDSNFFAYRHNRSLNALAVDGHVEGLRNRGDGFIKGFRFYNGGTIF